MSTGDHDSGAQVVPESVWASLAPVRNPQLIILSTPTGTNHFYERFMEKHDGQYQKRYSGRWITPDADGGVRGPARGERAPQGEALQAEPPAMKHKPRRDHEAQSA